MNKELKVKKSVEEAFIKTSRYVTYMNIAVAFIAFCAIFK